MIANEFNNTDLLMLVTIFLLLILLIFIPPTLAIAVGAVTYGASSRVHSSIPGPSRCRSSFE